MDTRSFLRSSKDDIIIFAIIASPSERRRVKRHHTLAGWGLFYTVALIWLTAIRLSAQDFKTELNFNSSTGGIPVRSTLIQGTDGNLYGTASEGGDYGLCEGGCGTVFKLTPQGKVTVLHKFLGTDGAEPEGGLVQGKDKNFHGTTSTGQNAFGAVFKIDAVGKLTIIHSFSDSDGAFPFGSLVQARDGNFYGTTYEGGTKYYGTVFRITPKGKLTTLYKFCQNGGTCIDGAMPVAGLLLAADGNFYGTTLHGGSDACSLGCGTIFRITRLGKLTTIYTFCSQTGCTDGNSPEGSLIQDKNGNLYGTTLAGGTGTCVTFGGGCGTLFKISPSGKLTTLYNFGGSDGAFPTGELLESGGSFYGVTYAGGSNTCSAGCGTVFVMTGLGRLTTVHRFKGRDGISPDGGLLRAKNGRFYGTTADGGTGGRCDPNRQGCGTVFSFLGKN
jgi:uncharacterized repeat protein (TIGR03803 family)